MENTIEAARVRYFTAVAEGDRDEFGSAKVALVELSTGRKLGAEEIAYI
ncbi:hypothetical protein [Rhodococcus erythropolis]|nr:hypothetical protein [Rhodococcus erythropolis]OFV72766.1 hypothetical protein RERY_65820 [Rhodococcus erythropolis]